MSVRWLVILLLVTCVLPTEAQLHLLTLREAENLVELVPDVVTSQRQGKCPLMSPGYTAEVKLDFWVRTSCGPESGMLIGAYTVDRETGAVQTWGDNPEPVVDSQGRELAAQLVQKARGRMLSAVEAHCLALSAATDFPGWSAPDVLVSVKPLGEPGTPSARANDHEGVMHFTAKRVSQSRTLETWRSLTVYLDEARVRDEETGMDVMSPAVSVLADELTQSREPVWLTDEEAASVALVVPRVVSNLKQGCIVHVGGPFYPREVSVGVSCKNVFNRESLVLVDLNTGAVRDPVAQRYLDTPESKRVAHTLLSAAQKHRTELEKMVEATCHPQ